MAHLEYPDHLGHEGPVSGHELGADLVLPLRHHEQVGQVIL